METVIHIAYIVSAILFVYGLKMLGRADTARKGNMVSALGMLVAIVVTLLSAGLNYIWILAGILIGSAIGAYAANTVQMTQMPEMVGLFNGSGGLASMLVGWAEFNKYLQHAELTGNSYEPDIFKLIVIFLAILVGGVTFTGSVVAFLKLSERMTGKPILLPNRQIINIGILAIAILSGVIIVVMPLSLTAKIFLALALITSLILGVMVVIPIGGADMPIVISLLNSYSGIAASMAGFIIGNSVLIVSGALVGASGIILTNIMCKAMNRSLANVLFSGFGSDTGAASGGAGQEQGEIKPLTAEDAYYMLEAASSVVVVPGYGMAVAQAQHVVKELADILEENGCDVKYAIHPVAGRMPGHMNVLLAEANVPYEQLVEPEDVNPNMEMVDIAIVIGANDVVNPSAKEDESSPLWGMPIIEVDRARTCFILKRSMNPGFSGVQNPLFFKENSRMIFGDAKETISTMISEFKDAQSE